MAVFKDAFSVTRLSFWTGAVLSSLIGSALFIVTQRSIETDAQARFTNYVKYAQNMIHVRSKSYTDLLRGTASLIQSSDSLSHRQFHEYVRGLDLPHSFPAVEYMNFALYVPGSQRAEFQRTLDREVQSVLGPGLHADIQPPGIRPSYLVVTYIEPDMTSLGFYGVDLEANSFFGNQLDQARDAGEIFTSGSPIKVLSRPNHIYLGVRTPVYRQGGPLDTVERRRAAYLGSLGIAFSIPKLLHGVMDEIPVPGMRMTLYDVGPDSAPGAPAAGRIHAAAEPHVLFDTAGTEDVPSPALDAGPNVFTVTLPLDFNGRPWKTVYSVRKDALYSEFDHTYPRLMMGFGFVGAILLYALLHTLAASRRAALVLAREMTRELRESQDKLQLSHQKLRRLADHGYQIKEQERKRIAREIHDDLGQSLLALRIETEMLTERTRGSHSHLHKRARATLAQIDATIKSVRQIINDLRPTVLDLGLSAAVEWQVNQFQRRTGIQCEVIDEHGEIALPDHSATAFFRILQESLTNVVRHAHATRVTVELRLGGGWLTLTVTDNGRGLPPGGQNKHGSFGLVGIEERIVILGGTCTVFSEPAGGTTVMVSAPVIGVPAPPLPAYSEREPGPAVI